MKKSIFIIALYLISSTKLNAQQGVSINSSGNNPDPSAMIDVSSTAKGALIPRMTTGERNAILSPANSLLIFNITDRCLQIFNGNQMQWENIYCYLGCTAAPAMPGSISGNASPCINSAGNIYTINQVAGATSYTWTAPSGATIVVGQGTPGVSVNFDTVSGNIAVSANNSCGAGPQQTLAVTLSTSPDAAGTISGTASVCPDQTGVSYSVSPITGATSYVWSYSGTGFSIVSGSGTNNITADFSSATAGIITVYGSNACGNGSASPDYSISIITAPSAPVAVSGTNETVNSFLANWNVSSGATTYYLDVATDAGFTGFVTGYNNLNAGNVLSNNVTGLTCNTTYYYRVRAANSCGTSSNSNTITAATSPCQCPNYWMQMADMGGNGRSWAAGFVMGTKAYISTGVGSAQYKDLWEWDQATNSWTQKADFPGHDRYGAIGFAIGTKGYVGTGVDGSGPAVFYKDFYEWDQTGNTWTQKTDFPGIGRSYAIGFSIGNKGYVGGGENFSTVLQDFWEYDQAGNNWVSKGNLPGSERKNAVSFVIGTKAYIGTGWNYGGPMNTFWEYDQGSSNWTQKANFPGASRLAASGFSIGTKGYIGVGTNNTVRYKDFYEWDQTGNSWVQKADFGSIERSGGPVGFSIGTKGYFCAGNDATGDKKDLWQWCQQ